MKELDISLNIKFQVKASEQSDEYLSKVYKLYNLGAGDRFPLNKLLPSELSSQATIIQEMWQSEDPVNGKVSSSVELDLGYLTQFPQSQITSRAMVRYIGIIAGNPKDSDSLLEIVRVSMGLSGTRYHHIYHRILRPEHLLGVRLDAAYIADHTMDKRGSSLAEKLCTEIKTRFDLHPIVIKTY